MLKPQMVHRFDFYFKKTNKSFDLSYQDMQENLCYLFFGKSHLLTVDKSSVAVCRDVSGER